MLGHLQQRLRLLASEGCSWLRKAASTERVHGFDADARQLEQRILLSATPLAVIAEGSHDASAEISTAARSDGQDLSSTAAPSATETRASQQEDRTVRLLFVDSTVEDFDTFLQLRESEDGFTQTVLLDANRNGISQISDALERYGQVDEIHLVSHGSDGRVRVGDTVLSEATLSEHRDALASWRERLSEDADILIYGCNVAESEEGKELTRQLAELTEADVAASEDQTGHASLEADWELEFQVGSVNLQSLPSAVVENWQGLLMTHSLSGTIYEDVNGDGDLTGDSGADNVDVHLFLDDGDGNVSVGDTLFASTTTNGTGAYQFLSVPTGDYFVVVDSKTITPSAGFNGGFDANDVWAVQTYGTDTSLVADGAGGTEQRIGNSAYGGRQAGVSDAFDTANLLASQHVTQVGLTADVSNIDFGFSFNVVTNVLGGDAADNDATSNRTIQGSLRQFIQNANAISGANVMRFVPAEVSTNGSGSNQYWQVDVTTLLPALSDTFTTIDGAAYSFTDGTALRDANAGAIGTVTSVGLGADAILGTGDETNLTGTQRPELQISTDSANNLSAGIRVEGNDNTIRNIAVRGFGDAGVEASANIQVDNANDLTIDSVLIGVNADDSSDLDTLTGGGNRNGIFLLDSDNSKVSNSFVGGSGYFGIQLQNSDYATIEGNQIRRNALSDDSRDGIALREGAHSNAIRFNLITQNTGGGIDAFRSSGDNIVTQNTITNNVSSGIIGDGHGVRLYGDNNEVTFNRIAFNRFDGVLVIGDDGDPNTPSHRNLISRNSFEGNDQSIDLSGTSALSRSRGDGEDAIDGDNANRGNNGVDRPQLNAVSLIGGTWTVDLTGSWSGASHSIELYIASAADGQTVTSANGEGGTFVGEFRLSGGAYGITTAGATPVVGDYITAIVIDNQNNTSEFSNNVALVGNAAPTLALTNTTTSLAENTDTSSNIQVADIVIADDGNGTNSLSLSGADASAFSIVGSNLFLNAGTSLDFETQSSYVVVVEVDDTSVGSTPDDSQTLTLNVTDINEAPSVALANQVSPLSENTDTSTAIRVADIVVTDDALGTETLSLSGADAAQFEIVGTELRLRAGTTLDFETKNNYAVTVEVDDTSIAGTPDSSANFALSLTDVNEAPNVTLTNTVTSLAESTNTTSAIRVADIVISDDALGTETLSLSGADAGQFEIVGTELRLRAGTTLDFESKDNYSVTVEVDDTSITGSPDSSANFALSITDVNEAPTVTLTNTVTSLAESTNTGTAIRVADIVVADDALGTETLSLSGADAGQFEIVGTELRLRAGTTLDFETKNSYSVTVEVDDIAIAGNPDDTAAHVLSITNTNDPPSVSATAPPALSFAEDTNFRTTVNSWFSAPDAADSTLAYQVVSMSEPNIRASFDTDGVTLLLSSSANFVGTGSLVVRATDSASSTAEHTVSINVTPVNDTLHPTDQRFAGVSGDTLRGNLLPRATDVDGEALVAVLLTPPSDGRLTVNPDGTFQFESLDFVGTTRFTYQIDDGVAPSNPAEVTLVLAAVANTPAPVDTPPIVGPAAPPVTTTPEQPSDSQVDSPTEEAEQPAAAQEEIVAAPSNGGSDDDEQGKVGPPPIATTGSESILEAETKELEAFAPAERAGANLRSTSGSSTYQSTLSSVGQEFAGQAANLSDLETAQLTSTLFTADGALFQELDEFREESQPLTFTHVVAGTVGSATSSIIVGYVIWAVRSGLLMSSVVASMPAWRFLDPIVVLSGGDDEEDQESLEDIVKAQQERVNDAAQKTEQVAQ